MDKASPSRHISHASPWIDDDGDILVSTASSLSESDPDFDTTSAPDTREESPRVRNKAGSPAPLPTPSTSPPSSQTAPVLRTPRSPKDKPSTARHEDRSPVAYTSSTASTSPTSVSAVKPLSRLPELGVSRRLAAVLANLIHAEKASLLGQGASETTITQLTAIVSMLPYGLNQEVPVGSEMFFAGLKQALKRTVSGSTDADALKQALRGVLEKIDEPKTAGQKVLKLLALEIVRGLSRNPGKPSGLELDAADKGNAAWLNGPYQPSSFSLPEILGNALSTAAPQLIRILGGEVVRVLYKIQARLPTGIGCNCYDSKEKVKAELAHAIGQLKSAADAHALLKEAGIRLGERERWDDIICRARSMILPAQDQQRVPPEIMSACLTVFTLLRLI